MTNEEFVELYMGRRFRINNNWLGEAERIGQECVLLPNVDAFMIWIRLDDGKALSTHQNRLDPIDTKPKVVVPLPLPG
jgi:hypothetical protein